MRIITVNLPESYLKAIDHLTGENAIYPSRSELIRVAVREFLIKELNSAQTFSQFQPHPLKITPQDPKISIDEDVSIEIDKNFDDTLDQES